LFVGTILTIFKKKKLHRLEFLPATFPLLGSKKINLAPISTPMWKFWTYLSDDEVKECEERALSCHNMAKKDGVLIPNAFPLAMFGHHKYTTTAIMLHTKQDMMTCNPRDKKYTSTFWNCQRPYIRCSCAQDASTGYKGNMLWFDHAIWFIINNMDRFFDDNYPTLATKLGAFIM
jgi:hypothetical protein